MNFSWLVSLALLPAIEAFSPRPSVMVRPSMAQLATREHVPESLSITKGDRDILMTLFNNQVTREFEASQLYLAASIWFDGIEMVGMASFMLGESNDERMHGLQFINFASKRDIPISLENLDAPEADWETPEDVWNDVLGCERENTQSLLNLADAAQACHDHAILAFLQDFHIEQVNSEDKLKGILAKVRDEDKTPGLLRQLDTELANESASHG